MHFFFITADILKYWNEIISFGNVHIRPRQMSPWSERDKLKEMFRILDYYVEYTELDFNGCHLPLSALASMLHLWRCDRHRLSEGDRMPGIRNILQDSWKWCVLLPCFNPSGNQNKIHFREKVLDQSFHTDIFFLQMDPSSLGRVQRRVLKVTT